MRLLTYSIPLQLMCQAGACQAMIAREAINVNGQCSVNFVSLHTSSETLSTMVLTMLVRSDGCNYVHRAMQKVITEALKIYSPDTEIIQVTDIPVDNRTFNVKEIL